MQWSLEAGAYNITGNAPLSQTLFVRVLVDVGVEELDGRAEARTRSHVLLRARSHNTLASYVWAATKCLSE